MMIKTLQFTTFYVREFLLALNVREVREILHYQPITPVALMPDFLSGLLNLRGQIVTVLDLRRIFGLPPRADDTARMHIIVQADDEDICLLVDCMHTIIAVPEHELLPPGAVQGEIAKYVRNVCQIDENLILVLDMPKIVQAESHHG